MPLVFDMPYDDLLGYTGTNPRPDDFDEFWDKALAELAATDPQVELVPAAFQVPFARCEHLYFLGTGGERVHAKLVRPLLDGEPAPAVLRFHGYGGESAQWTDLLAHAARGHTIADLDVRRQVGYTTDDMRPNEFTLMHHVVSGLDQGPQDLLYKHVFLDTVRLAQLVMALDGVDPDRVATTGASQGGGLSLACAALEPRIRLVAAIYPFLCDYRRAYDLSLDTEPYNEIATWFRKRDPRHRREQEVFTRLGYVDVQHLAPRIRAQVDLTVGLEDQVCPPSTQFAAYNKIVSDKSVRLYPDHGHDDLPGLNDVLFELLGTL